MTLKKEKEMMYNRKFVAVVKNNGKILREHGETVYIPFGTEYSIDLKNLESRKAVVKINIDGTDVLGNHSVIINSNEEISLERFIVDSDLHKGNRFKFIQKTKEISLYRGDKIDDGIIRIEFRFEKEYELPRYTLNRKWENHNDFIGMPDGPWILGDNITSVDNSYSIQESTIIPLTTYNKESSVNCSIKESLVPSINIQDDNGITVKGSISDQGFRFGYVNNLEDTIHTIVMVLKGCNSKEIKITKPITIRTRLICETCGRKSKSNNKFCPRCGTSLI